MKCPIDQTEMKEGWFTNGRWCVGPMKEVSWLIRPMPSITVKSMPAVTWRCPKCGKLEFYTEAETK